MEPTAKHLDRDSAGDGHQTISAPATLAARMEDGTKVYGAGPTTVTAIDHVSATFASGLFTAIMGPSGSGKSTLLHCLAGLDRLTSGRVFVGEVDLSRLDDTRLTMLRRERIGFVFQSFNLVPTLTAYENIALPLVLGGHKPDAAWVEGMAKAVGIADRLSHHPSELSGGQQQRVAVARALITQPLLLFADEPTGNLDSKSAAGLLDEIRRAVNEMQQTVIMVTHDPKAAGYADRVLFLADGRVAGHLDHAGQDDILEAIRTLGE